MRKSWIIGVLILLIVAVLVVIFIKPFKAKVTTYNQTSEKYCTGFAFDKCPGTCKVGASTPEGDDLTCHSTKFYDNFPKAE